MKRMRAWAIGAAVAALAFVSTTPAQGVGDYLIYVNDKYDICTAIGAKGNLYAYTANTEWDQCWYVETRAYYQPPANQGPSWTSWKQSSTKATWKFYSGYVINGQHHPVYTL